MSFLAPWMMVAGVVAALGVFALHLLTTRKPPAVMLPTARFVPESEMRAVARASRPTDIPLLLLRAIAVLAVGAAFARPVLNAPGPQVRTVVALEWTHAIADVEAARAAVRPFIGRGNALVLFDTAARELPLDAFDTLSAPSPMLRRARISPMLVVAREVGARIARGADSVRLVVFTRVSADGLDAATAAWRAAWPGRIEVRPISVEADTVVSPRVELRGALPTDPLLPALAKLDSARGRHAVRLLRVPATAEDAAWVREVPGAVLVLWPATFTDSVVADGVVAFEGGRVAPLVAPLARMMVAAGRPIARWRDGAPAATESVLGVGCSRSVGVGVPAAGDLVLRPPFEDFLAAMLAPCGGARAAPLPDSTLAWLASEGPLASGSALAATDVSSPLTKWLLLTALLVLMVEQLVRRRRVATEVPA